MLGVKIHNEYCCSSSDVATLYRGVVERVFVSKHDADEGQEYGRPRDPGQRTFAAMVAPFDRELKRYARGLAPWSHEYFVATRGRKRLLYESALKRMYGRGLQAKDSTLSIFVKVEKENLTKKPNPCPRIISPRSPAYNICVGVFVAPLEKVLYEDIGQVFGHRVVAKGLNALDRGQLMAELWELIVDPVGVGGDAHRLDQHMHQSALRHGHKQYNRYFHSRKLMRLLGHQLVNSAVGYCYDGVVKFKCFGRRASGEMDTSLGNTLTMVEMAYSALSSLGFVPAKRCSRGDPRAYALIDDGDDFVIFLARTSIPRLEGIEDWFRAAGFPVAMEEPVYELEHVAFCQTQPVFDGLRWTMVRDPRVCIDKDVMSLKPCRTEAEWNTLRNTVGLSGLALAGHMPIFSEFYEALRRGAGTRVDKDSTVTGFKMLARGMNMSKVPVTPAARASFFRAFDITPDAQVAIEQFYREMQPKWRVPVRQEAVQPLSVGCCMGFVC